MLSGRRHALEVRKRAFGDRPGVRLRARHRLRLGRGAARACGGVARGRRPRRAVLPGLLERRRPLSRGAGRWDIAWSTSPSPWCCAPGRGPGASIRPWRPPSRRERARRALVEKWADALEGRPDEPGHDRAYVAAHDGGAPLALVIDHGLPDPDRDAGSGRLSAMLDGLRELGCRVILVPDDGAELEPSASRLRGLGGRGAHGPGRRRRRPAAARRCARRGDPVPAQRGAALSPRRAQARARGARRLRHGRPPLPA